MVRFESILLVGGTSEIGLGVVSCLAKRGAKVVHLLARDIEGAKSAAEELAGDNPEFQVFSSEFSEDLDLQIQEIMEFMKVDLVLIAVGQMINQNSLYKYPNLTKQINLANVELPTVALFAALKYFEELGRGQIAVFGSVAGDRGRSVNAVYGAGKAYIETICEGIWQRIVGTDIGLTLIKPGPTRTKMSMEIHKGKVKLASVEQVSDLIADGLVKRKSIIYAPRAWRYIMKVVKSLPRYVFNRTSF